MASEVENLLEPDKRASSTAPRLEGSGFHLDWPDTADSAREATLRRLRSLVPEADPVREDVHVSARSRLDPRSIDDEPAGLVYDSTIDDELLASVRSGRRSIRQLTFAARPGARVGSLGREPSGGTGRTTAGRSRGAAPPGGHPGRDGRRARVLPHPGRPGRSRELPLPPCRGRCGFCRHELDHPLRFPGGVLGVSR